MTEGRNFKTFMKENYAIALNSCYLFNKNEDDIFSANKVYKH